MAPMLFSLAEGQQEEEPKGLLAFQLAGEGQGGDETGKRGLIHIDHSFHHMAGEEGGGAPLNDYLQRDCS